MRPRLSRTRRRRVCNSMGKGNKVPASVRIFVGTPPTLHLMHRAYAQINSYQPSESDRLKEMGNASYKRGDFSEAIRLYRWMVPH